MNRAELAKVLTAGNYKESYYSLYEPPHEDAFHLHQHDDGTWAIYSFERGRATTVGTYSNEDEACRRLHQLLSDDPSSRR